MKMTKRDGKVLGRLAVALAVAACGTSAAKAEDLSNLDKGHRLLIQNGLQVIGLVDLGTPFHIETYQAANYTSVLWWMASTNPSAAPNVPWAESVPDPSLMPHLDPALNGAYMDKLVGLSLGDEQNLNDRSPGGTFDRNVAWVQQAKANPVYNNTIIYTNSWGSQLLDQNLNDFIDQARPDMVSFDTYPWVGGGVAGGSPADWYTWMRRYRVYANAYNIPFAVYRQTYHATSENRVDPTPSQQNLNTFAALAFGSTYLADFTYNSGATSLFDRYPSDPNHGAGDLLPNDRYYQQATINMQARNLGKALVRLKQVGDHAGETFAGKGSYSAAQPGHTTSMMIVRGKHKDGGGTTVFNDLPIGFENDPSSAATPSGVGYSDWVAKVNDPYLIGGFVLNGPNNYGVTNLGTKNDGLPGDVILSWFTPMDESFDGPDYSDERYLMIVNGLTGIDGTAADYRQRILLDFDFAGAPANLVKNKMERLDENTGTVVDVPLTLVSGSRYRLTVELDGGMGALFKFKDGAPFVGFYAPPHMTGDTNSDGVVDLIDLNNVLNNFGANGSNVGDENSDGLVDLVDLNNVLNNFGATGAAGALSTVPEPASLSLVALGAAAILGRRRR